jgi:putative flavoprotein involved in K+ transport
VWGLGSGTTQDPGPWEGELRNMWKPTQQENLWFHGGNLHQSRHYSLFLALQLKARYEGIPTPVYGLQEVHQLSWPPPVEIVAPQRVRCFGWRSC